MCACVFVCACVRGRERETRVCDAWKLVRRGGAAVSGERLSGCGLSAARIASSRALLPSATSPFPLRSATPHPGDESVPSGNQSRVKFVTQLAANFGKWSTAPSSTVSRSCSLVSRLYSLARGSLRKPQRDASESLIRSARPEFPLQFDFLHRRLYLLATNCN